MLKFNEDSDKGYVLHFNQEAVKILIKKLQFNQEAQLKELIYMNTELRKQVKHDFQTNFFKLLNNF